MKSLPTLAIASAAAAAIAGFVSAPAAHAVPQCMQPQYLALMTPDQVALCQQIAAKQSAPPQHPAPQQPAPAAPPPPAAPGGGQLCTAGVCHPVAGPPPPPPSETPYPGLGGNELFCGQGTCQEYVAPPNGLAPAAPPPAAPAPPVPGSPSAPQAPLPPVQVAQGPEPESDFTNILTGAPCNDPIDNPDCSVRDGHGDGTMPVTGSDCMVTMSARYPGCIPKNKPRPPADGVAPVG
jgi:hypothetical protein